jgi:hypothetical protein
VKYTKKLNLLQTIAIISLAFMANSPALHAAQQPEKFSDGGEQTRMGSPTKPQRGQDFGPHKAPHGQNPYFAPYHAQAPCCAHQYPGYGYHPGFGPQTGAHTGNVNINFSSSNSSEQAALLHAAQQAHQEQYQQQHVETITLVSIAKECESFLSSYRWTVIFGFILAGYGMMYKRIKDDQKFLKRGKNWAHWRAYDTQSIESCLAADIQYRYFNPQDPANHAAALAECALDLEHEQMRYSRILRLYKWLKKWYLYLLFPMSEKDLKMVRESRERLEAMRRIYLRLIATRNPYVSNQTSNNQGFSNQAYNELPCMLPCCNPV